MDFTCLDFFSYKVTQTTCCMQSANLGIPVLSTSWLYSRLSSIILVHSFHMLWLRLSWCVWRFPMHGYLVTSSLIRETTENESPKERYRFGPEEETYILYLLMFILAYWYFRYAGFRNSHSLHFFLDAGPVEDATTYEVIFIPWQVFGYIRIYILLVSCSVILAFPLSPYW